MKKIGLFIALLSLFSVVGFAQNQEGLRTRFKTITQGNILAIGNNILNRQTGQKPATLEYDELSQGMKPNDEFSMAYIDIDKDKSTFSSSSATLSFPMKKPKILFAGLYWSATYPYEKGKMEGKNYIAEDNTRKDVNNILLKLPKKKSYTAIEGKILFDGATDIHYINNSPYVAFADVTTLLQSLKNPAGEYVIANVHAANGYIEGGSAAGWTLIVVYEDPEEPMRKINIKDGFAEIGINHTMVTFDEFETPENEETIPRLAGATLEADAAVGENKLSVYTEKGGIYMETDTRSVSNFFNSSITEDEEYLTTRLPKSNNTLGFDVFSAEIPNFENVLIPKGTTSLEVSFTSSKDTFYLFLLALSIDSKENPFIPIKENKQETMVIPQEKKEEVSTEVAKSAKTEIIPTQTQNEQLTQQTEMPSNIRTVAIKDVQKGFYTILGAFSEEKNADNFIAVAKKKGVEANKFFYPDKKIFYVYNSFSATYNDALKKQMEFIKQKQSNNALKTMKDSWIFYIQN